VAVGIERKSLGLAKRTTTAPSHNAILILFLAPKAKPMVRLATAYVFSFAGNLALAYFIVMTLSEAAFEPPLFTSRMLTGGRASGRRQA
jgi:hypothetical protein